jgi:hypothetical protein
LRAHESNEQITADFLKAAIDSSAIAIRALILVNGAAVIALLAYLGAVESGVGAQEFKSTLLVWPILSFAMGVGLATTASALAYLVNMLDHSLSVSVTYSWEHPFVIPDDDRSKKRWRRNVLHYIAMVVAIGSLVSFFVGIGSSPRPYPNSASKSAFHQ